MLFFTLIIFLIPIFVFYFVLLFLPHLRAWRLMEDEIQPVLAADASGATYCNGDDGVGELEPHSECPS